MKRLVLAASAAGALALPVAAAAHVTVLPAFLERGSSTVLVFSAPNERPPHSVVGLTVTAPAGLTLARVAPPTGWTVSVTPRRAVWSGGRTTAHQVGVFRIRATTSLEPAAVTLRAVQRYGDGATVDWTVPFTVLPAASPPKEHLWPALVAGVVGLAAIAGGLAWLRLRQRP